MQRSKYSIFFGTLTFLCLFVLFLVYGNIFIKQHAKVYSTIGLVILFVFFTLYVLSIARIEIDLDKRNMLFSSFFSMKRKLIGFDEVDGCIHVIESTRTHIPNKSIYLVVDGKLQNRIASKYYSNFVELENALSSLHYFGETQLSFTDSVKLLLGKDVYMEL